MKLEYEVDGETLAQDFLDHLVAGSLKDIIKLLTYENDPDDPYDDKVIDACLVLLEYFDKPNVD
jgi:hypothetical protein